MFSRCPLLPARNDICVPGVSVAYLAFKGNDRGGGGISWSTLSPVTNIPSDLYTKHLFYNVSWTPPLAPLPPPPPPSSNTSHPIRPNVRKQLPWNGVPLRQIICIHYSFNLNSCNVTVNLLKGNMHQCLFILYIPPLPFLWKNRNVNGCFCCSLD